MLAIAIAIMFVMPQEAFSLRPISTIIMPSTSPFADDSIPMKPSAAKEAERIISQLLDGPVTEEQFNQLDHLSVHRESFNRMLLREVLKRYPQSVTRSSVEGQGKSIVAVPFANAVDVGLTYQRTPAGLLVLTNATVSLGSIAVTTAKTLRNFGWNVKVFGFGERENDRDIRPVLEELSRQEGIDVSMLETVPGNVTRVNLFIAGVKEKEIYHGSQGFKVERQKYYDLLDRLDQLTDPSFVIVGGTTPLGAGRDFFYRFIKKLQRNGHKVFFDFIHYLKDDEIETVLKAQPYAVKMNLTEFAKVIAKTEKQLTQDITYAASEAYCLARMHNIGILLVSMGEIGAILVDEKGKVFFAEAPKNIKVESTTGAGNSMMAALVDGLSRNKSSEEVLRYSTVYGSLTCTKPGTRVAQPQEVDEFLARNEVIVREIITTIDADSPDTTALACRLDEYFQKPFAGRTEQERICLLQGLGVNDPADFINKEAARHREENDRARSRDEKEAAYNIARSSGIDYLLDPHNPDLRISYRHREGANRPRSEVAVTQLPNDILARLFKIKFKPSGMEKTLISFMGLDSGRVSDFFASGGKLTFLELAKAGTNGIVKLMVQHPLFADGNPRVVFVKIIADSCINEFADRHTSSGTIPGYIREEKLRAAHADFVNYMSQRYNLGIPAASFSGPILIAELSGRDYPFAISGINDLTGLHDGAWGCEFLQNAGMNNAFIDLFALYDRIVTLKEADDKTPPSGGQYVVGYKDGSPVLALVDYDHLFKLDKFWRKLSAYNGNDPCRVIGELRMFSEGKKKKEKSLLPELPEPTEENLQIWHNAVSAYMKGYYRLWEVISEDMPQICRKIDECYRGPITALCENMLQRVPPEKRADVIKGWYGELPGTSKYARTTLRQYGKKGLFDEDSLQAFIAEDKERRDVFVKECSMLSPREIAEKFADTYVMRAQGQLESVVREGWRSVLEEVFTYYFQGLRKKVRSKKATAEQAGNTELEARLHVYEKEALSVIARFRKAPLVVVMGYPGSGKTSIGNGLSAALGIPHIAKGEVLRAMKARGLAHLDTVMEDYAAQMISRHIGENNIDVSRGLIIDWNPRMKKEEKELSQAFLDEHNLYLTAVIHVDVDRKTALERMGNRVDEKRIRWKDPGKRLDWFEAQGFPLIDKYRSEGLLIPITNEQGRRPEEAIDEAKKRLHETKALGTCDAVGVEQMLREEYPRLQQGMFAVVGERKERHEQATIEIENIVSTEAKFFFKDRQIKAKSRGSTARLTHSDDHIDFDITVPLEGNYRYSGKYEMVARMKSFGQQVADAMLNSAMFSPYSIRVSEYVFHFPGTGDLFVTRLLCEAPTDTLGIGNKRFSIDVCARVNKLKKGKNSTTSFQKKLEQEAARHSISTDELIANIRFFRHIYFNIRATQKGKKGGISSKTAEALIMQCGSFDNAMQLIYDACYDRTGRFLGISGLTSAAFPVKKDKQSIFYGVRNADLENIATLALAFRNYHTPPDRAIPIDIERATEADTTSQAIGSAA